MQIWSPRVRFPGGSRAQAAAAATEDEASTANEEGFEFTADYQIWLENTRQKSEEDYAELKASLLKRTQRGGTFLTLYIFLVVSSPAALCSMIGAGASYVYLLLLIADIDSRNIEDRNLVMEAEEMNPSLNKWITKGLGAYAQALQPRLLVPVALAAGAWYFNQNMETPLGLTEEGCLLLGFGSYKLALVIELWESLKPKPKSREEIDRESRPMLPEVEDVADVRPDLKDEKF